MSLEERLNQLPPHLRQAFEEKNQWLKDSKTYRVGPYGVAIPRDAVYALALALVKDLSSEEFAKLLEAKNAQV